MTDPDASSPMAFDATHGGQPHRVNTNADTPDPNLQSGVDAFFKSMCGSYQTPSGAVVVPTTFMMNPGYAAQRAFKANPDNQAAMARLASTAGLSQLALGRVQQGRGTPDEIHALTQALIDQQPPGIPLLNTAAPIWQPNDVRKLMHNHAIGIDCAGYVQQAYLRATGRTRAQLGFAPDLTNEGLFGLPQKGFAKFSAVADLRPGDIIVFNAPPHSDQPGHRTIVFDQRVATDDDTSAISAADGGPAFAAGGTLRVLEMDSSYGSGGYYGDGGVQREKWIFNETSQKWAYLHLLAAADSSSDPMTWAVDNIGTLYGPDDVLDGFYRRRGR
jgi:hypothetical protein